jgi:hypothetical protein
MLNRIQFAVMFNHFEHSKGCYVICFELRVPSATGCCDWCHVYVHKKNILIRTGVFPLKEIITVHRFVRFISQRSLKPEIFPTPVNEPHCFQHISGEFHSVSITVSWRHREVTQPVIVASTSWRHRELTQPVIVASTSSNSPFNSRYWAL